MQIQEFCKNNRKKIVGISLFIILEILSLLLGWITFANQFIITNSYSTYYLIGTTLCPLFFNGFNTHRISYNYCYQFDEDCRQANQIRNIFIAAQSLTLVLNFLFTIMLCLININRVQLCIKIIWTIASVVDIGLYLYDAVITEIFVYESKFQVNLVIIYYIWSLFGVRIIQLTLLIYNLFCNQWLIPIPVVPHGPPVRERDSHKFKPLQVAQVHPIIVLEDEEYFTKQTYYDPIDQDAQIR